MDLTDLFRERTAQPPAEILHHLRMSGVRRRVATRRRRRIASGAAALAGLALAGFGAVALVNADRTVEPAGTIEGFPEYHEGTRVIAAASGSLTEPLEFSFTPGAADLTLFWRCDPAGADDLHLSVLEIRLDGEVFMTMTGDVACDGQDQVGGPERWADFDLPAGEPSTVTATIVDGPVDQSGATWGVAVAEAVPFEEYVFPTRPTTLPDLTEPSDECDYEARLRADPAAPNRPAEAVLPLTTYRVDLYTQTPGQLTIRVNGVTAGRAEVWTYGGYSAVYLDPTELREAGLADEPGEDVTVTFVPAHLTGDWNVLVTSRVDEQCL